MNDESGTILAEVKFGRAGRLNKADLRNAAESYLASLLKTGQICGDYLLAWNKGSLIACVMLTGPDAFQARNHSAFGRQELAKIRAAFGSLPTWTVRDDDCPPRPLTWKKAPFLYLFTHAFDIASPVNHGASGKAIPVYTIPIPFESKESLYFWQGSYREFDKIQLGCGAWEIPAYREMADPNSELARHGRDLCARVEAATKLPTYYYLARYWGRPKNEAERRCPGCREAWKVGYPLESPGPFHHFEFRCESCRLVSHLGTSADGRKFARIGEFHKKNKTCE